MVLGATVDGFFTEEWERFKDGVTNLHPDEVRNRQLRDELARRAGDPSAIIRMPGIDDVIRLGPRYVPTAQERTEFYSARREGRAPDISTGAAAEIQRRADLARAIRLSPDRDVSAGWGQILTALDNVQDLAATISAFGRLAVWAMPRLLARAVPGIGVILTISDLINLLSFLGMLATPLWAFLCNGPANALAAGVPAVAFKRALKGEAWRRMFGNPFARKASFKLDPGLYVRPGSTLLVTKAGAQLARARAFGRLPGITNLIEGAQTTEALFGYGLSLGAIVGAITGLAQGAALQAQGATIRAGSTPGSIMLDRTVNRPLRADHPADMWRQLDAAAVLYRAPVVLAHAALLSDTDVLLAVVALHQAAATWGHRLRAYDVADAVAAGWSEPLTAAAPTSAVTVDVLRSEFVDTQEPARWPLPGAPTTITGDEYAAWIVDRIPGAIRDWLVPRRNTAEGLLVGALIGEATEQLWRLPGENDDPLRWEWGTDARLISSLAEEGLLPVPDAPRGPLWSFWQAARRELEATAATTLPAPTWQRLLEAHAVPYARLLPPDAPWPPEWADFLAPAPPSS